ncbi:MAG TPA: DUF2089 family protein [Acidobacteriota bacterium]|nr:DUF2089 family protein [Acidobacteriota bacterium]
MAQEWFELIKFTDNQDFIIEKIRLKEKDITVEGEFELPPLSRLSNEDQIFIIAFLKTHGNIRDMEKLFGISYPSVKNRLNKISKQLEFVEVNPPTEKNEVLEQLYRDEITVEEALGKLGGKK